LVIVWGVGSIDFTISCCFMELHCAVRKVVLFLVSMGWWYWNSLPAKVHKTLGFRLEVFKILEIVVYCNNNTDLLAHFNFFLQTTEEGTPLLDWGHVIECLNKVHSILLPQYNPSTEFWRLLIDLLLVKFSGRRSEVIVDIRQFHCLIHCNQHYYQVHTMII
jgi:hypothetical protein